MMIILILKLLKKLAENSLKVSANSITQIKNYYLEKQSILKEISELFLLLMIIENFIKLKNKILNIFGRIISIKIFMNNLDKISFI